MNRIGILLLGHGTPAEEGTRAFLEFVHLVEEMAGKTPVSAGFMDFASPTIAQGVAVLHQRGVVRIAAVPVFLSGAGHTAEDIPKCIAEVQKLFGDMQIHLTPHVGSHPKVAELSALRYNVAMAGRTAVPEEETLVVLAAHGSPEPEAMLELEKFALARQELTPTMQIVPCFSQMGAPLLKDILPTLVENRNKKPSPPAPLRTPTEGWSGEGRKRIVVQPHFLLQGRLVESIAYTTAAVAEQHPEIDFVVTEPLGFHRLLAEAVLELGVDSGQWIVDSGQ